MPLRLIAFVFLFSTEALAHDWYPIECCHVMDCAPVERVDSAADDMAVTSKHGSVVVPATFPRRQSQDHRMHVCMRPGQAGSMRLICIFLPPSS